MWSTLDMGDGAVGTGAREARRGEGGEGSAAASSDMAGQKWLLTRTGASGHCPPRQPTRAWREATLPLTAGPTRQRFPYQKLLPDENSLMVHTFQNLEDFEFNSNLEIH
jgi:hypothetical protein